ncbi:uncharacterized protein LOC107312967 [Coturnix japonica]|uniref:uncharacterized protein LOC107312967 n=1 Tax=Coturnix japonica TaxID=93934 RepID=UPI000776E75D|nr:uncharacterized protein LOC107312967 [Coturnix japonica]
MNSSDIPGRARVLGVTTPRRATVPKGSSSPGCLSLVSGDMEMPKEEEPKAQSQPNEGLPSAQEHHQANDVEHNETLSHRSTMQEDTDTVPSLPSLPDPQEHKAGTAAHREAGPASSCRGYAPQHQKRNWADENIPVLEPCISCQVIGAKLWAHHEDESSCREILLLKQELLMEMSRSCMAYTGQSLAKFREITRQARKLRKQRAGQDVPCVSQYELEDGGDDEEPKIENHWVNPRITAFFQDPQEAHQQTPDPSSITDTEASGESDGQAQSTALSVSRHTDAEARASVLAGSAWDDAISTRQPPGTGASSGRGAEKAFVPEAPGQQEPLPPASRTQGEGQPRRALFRRWLGFGICCSSCITTEEE